MKNRIMKTLTSSVSLIILSLTNAEEEFFANHCFDCHDDLTTKADFRMDSLLEASNFDADFIKWEHVLTHLMDRSMPPRKRKDRPEHEEYETTITWLREQLIAAEQQRAENKPKWMRRLNRDEYNNTIRDLFGVDGLTPADPFPMDDALHGFDNVAEGLTVSPIHVEAWLNAAYDALDEIILTGPEPDGFRRRLTIDYYTTKDGDGTLKWRNGNSFVTAGQKGPRLWIGGPLHAQVGVPDPGNYRVSIRGVPHQFGEHAGGFITTVNGRGHRNWDVLPEPEGKLVTMLEFETWLPAARNVIEVEWTENQNGMGVKRAGATESQSPFRRLQAVGREHPDATVETKLKLLNWPYVRNLEFEIVGPLHESWPPPSTQQLLAATEVDGDFAPVFTAFLPRAFRRPVSNEEIRHYAKLCEAELEAGEPWTEALKHGLAAAMVSPHFLFLMETPRANTPKGGYTLTDHELANRLSYFLWSTMPDEELFAAAETGMLRNPDMLRNQVARMLADPKARALTEGFGEQWLGVRRIPGLMPEPSVFGGRFDEYIHAAMAQEPVEFFDVIRRDNLSLETFLNADFAVVNGPLAVHYGMEGVHGQAFRRVPVSDPNRGSLITQAGYLAMTSEATRTSPVKRGIWILEHLFHRPPPPPPPNVGNLIEEDDPKVRPISEHLELHRENLACASCHEKIDPWGLALERFDAIGAYREQDRVIPPDEIYLPPWKQKPVTFEFLEFVEFDDGMQVRDMPQFKAYLLSRKDEFARGFAEQMAIHALGRELLIRDQAALDSIVNNLRDRDYRFHVLVEEIVLSKPFQTR